MEIDFWAARWKEGRIGFHEGRANAFLEKHIAVLGDAAAQQPRSRILVPLCGKAEDMMFLASQGYDVVGIEVVDDAVQAFFTEHGLSARVHGSDGVLGDVRTYEAKIGGGATGPTITIHSGDFFACTAALIGPVSAFYDRAALVALPGEMRPRYVAHLRALLAPRTPGLVITFDYPQAQMDGPPFAVGEFEVKKLFEGAEVASIDDAPAVAPRFAESGVLAIERCFRVQL